MTVPTSPLTETQRLYKLVREAADAAADVARAVGDPPRRRTRLPRVKAAWMIVCVVGLLVVGCGDNTESTRTGASDPKPESKPSLETRINVEALGFALDSFRSSAEFYVESLRSCADLARLGSDRASNELCFRRASRDFQEQVEVVGASLVEVGSSAGGSCSAQLLKVGNRIIAAARVTVPTATDIAIADPSTSVSPLLDKIDRSFARLDSAYARAQRLCGGG